MFCLDCITWLMCLPSDWRGEKGGKEGGEVGRSRRGGRGKGEAGAKELVEYHVQFYLSSGRLSISSCYTSLPSSVRFLPQG